jgi:hypothetical protein
MDLMWAKRLEYVLEQHSEHLRDFHLDSGFDFAVLRVGRPVVVYPLFSLFSPD